MGVDQKIEDGVGLDYFEVAAAHVLISTLETAQPPRPICDADDMCVYVYVCACVCACMCMPGFSSHATRPCSLISPIERCVTG